MAGRGEGGRGGVEVRKAVKDEGGHRASPATQLLNARVNARKAQI